MAGPWEKYAQQPAAPTGGVTVGQRDPYKVAAEQRAQEDQTFQREKFAWEKKKFEAEQAKGGDGAKQIPPAAAAGIQSNLETLRTVEAAIAALKGRPQSIGPGTGALGDTFTQFNDPGGTDTRSRVGKIGAVTIHDLSGAAVSASEAPRFQPFVPTVTDRPDVAETKLNQFREALQAQIKEALDYYGPNNGYMPYDTPQAKTFLTGGFGKPEDDGTPKMTPEQQAAYDALVASGATADQIRAFGDRIGMRIENANDVANVRDQGGGFVSGGNAKYNRPEEVQQRIDARPDGGVAAGFQGLTDAGTLGFNDEIAAGADAVAGALQGQGSVGDLYNQNIQVERGYKDALRNENWVPFTAGQVIGGLALPGSAATTPGRLAALGAGYGGLYGIGSGTDAQSRITGGVLGAGTGAATGYGLGKLSDLIRSRQAPGQVPPLVDPATGALNEPLEAAGPAGRVGAAKDFGIDLPMGSAGDRTASLIEKGLDNLPGSAGVMNDSRRVVEGQVRGAVDNVAGKFGSSRTLNEGGAELQRGAAQRIERGKAVIDKAYQAIPIADQAPASTSNTVSTLQQLTGRFQSNPELAASLKDPKLVGYLNAMQKGLSWKDLKDFRTIIGEKIGEMRFGESSSTSDLRALYAGLSEDMRNTAASQGPGALRAFERANSLNRNNEEVIQNALTRILGKDGQMAPEKAAAAVQAMTKGGKSTGDLKTLAQIRAATVKSGAWDEIAATLIRLGGQPANSEGRAFNPQTFVQWYSDMAEPARKMLFGSGELRQSLDSFVAVNQRLANSNALRNTSNTAPGIMAAGTVGTAGMAMMSPMLGLKLLAAGGANFGMAKAWTNPAFVRWATGFSKAAASGNQNAVRSQVGRLSVLATKNPNIRDVLTRLEHSLLNDNVPATGTLAASPDQRPDQQQ